jgi:dTDP-4-dehydrorhamnose reductase
MKNTTKTEKILITGSKGYIGKNLTDFFTKKDYLVFGIDLQNDHSKNYFQCDLTNQKEVEKIILKVKPDIIIHCVALSSLDGCEKNPELAQKVNLLTTQYLTDCVNQQKLKTILIFLSSDYVFDGEKGNYKEEDSTLPKSVYGKTKLLSEKYIKENLKNFIIIRTANVHGNEGGNFYNFVRDNLKNNQEIEVFDDAYFTPTHISKLLSSLFFLLKHGHRGVFHVTGDSCESRYTFALKIAEEFNLNKKLLKKVHKPKNLVITSNSCLNNSKISKLIKSEKK